MTEHLTSATEAFSEINEAQARQILAEEKAHFLMFGTYIREAEFVWKLADRYAGCPEEHTELCGKKWGMQR